MNNTLTTSPSKTTALQATLKPAHKGLYLVTQTSAGRISSSRTRASAPASAPTAPRHGLSLAASRTFGAPQPADLVEVRSAESVRIKLAACFGAVLTAPLVWCLHTLLLSIQTH